MAFRMGVSELGRTCAIWPCRLGMHLADGTSEAAILAAGYEIDGSGRIARLGNSQRHVCDNCERWWKDAPRESDGRLLCSRCYDEYWRRRDPKHYPPLF